MKKIRHQFLLFLLLNLAPISPARALVCPDRKAAPECPTSGSTILDERYPTQAYVISNQAFHKSKESTSVTQQFISKIIKAHNYESVPQVIVPVATKDEFNKIVSSVKDQLRASGIAKDQIEKVANQITWVNLPNYTWQQDWFESFFDPKTGAPVIRQIGSYDRVSRGASAKLTSTSKECDMKEGSLITENFGSPKSPQDIIDHSLSFGGGEMGGNIEGAPGGFCMVGDNAGKEFTKQFCGKEENIIQLQTSWLLVGHVDEIFKIIPTNFNDGRPKECEFSLMSASPRKALEIMSHPQRGQIPFVDLDVNNGEKDLNEVKLSRSNQNWGPNRAICFYIHNAVLKNPARVKSLPSSSRSVLIKLFFGNSAYADSSQFTINQNRSHSDLLNNCVNNLDSVSNFEMKEVMEADPNFSEYNEAIQISIDRDRALIREKILSRLPQCKSYYDELEVPNIFYGGLSYTDSKTKSLELIKPGAGNSFLPNPTNSVLMNKTVTFPDTGNNAFNLYLKDEMEKRKLKHDFIPTWEYAHIGNGNIHCASHSISYCRPKK